MSIVALPFVLLIAPIILAIVDNMISPTTSHARTTVNPSLVRG